MTLKCDNRSLTRNAKFSYLSDNYASGVTSLVLVNSTGFATSDFILIGEFGQETSEILKISAVTASTNTLTVNATKFAHSQDTKVTVIKYNQVKFYRTATATFSESGNELTKSLGSSTTQFDITNTAGSTYRYTYDSTGTDPDIDVHIAINSEVVINAQNFTAANNGTFEVTGVGTSYFEVTNASGVAEDNKTIGTGSIKYSTNIQAEELLTLFYDTTNTTGFGWFKFYNSTTQVATDQSNAIPYADFSEYSVKKIFDSFFSLLNNKEKKLIDNDDAFRFLNEGYSIAQNELNLVNPEYTVPSKVTLTTVANTQEYALSTYLTNFSDIISVTNQYGDKVPYIDLKDVVDSDYQGGYSESSVSYYLRGSYIGFSPVPTAANSYYIYYRQTSATLSSYYDEISLPDNNFYPIVDWMFYRAAIKLGKPNPERYLQAFQTGINRMKVVSVKQNSNEDQIGITDEANV